MLLLLLLLLFLLPLLLLLLLWLPLEWQRSSALGAAPEPRVDRDGAGDDLGGKLQKENDSLGSSRRQGSEASRAPGIAEQLGHDTGAALGSGQQQKKGLELGVAYSKRQVHFSLAPVGRLRVIKHG